MFDKQQSTPNRVKAVVYRLLVFLMDLSVFLLDYCELFYYDTIEKHIQFGVLKLLLIGMGLHVDLIKRSLWGQGNDEFKVILRFGSVGFQTLAFAASSCNSVCIVYTHTKYENNCFTCSEICLILNFNIW